MRKAAPLLCGLQLIIVVGALGQRQSPQVDVDHAAFAYDEQVALLEVYLGFEARHLPFDARRTGFIAELPLEIAVYQRSETSAEQVPDEPLWYDDSAVVFAVADTSGLETGQFFVHQVRIPAAPGRYRLVASLPADQGRGRGRVDVQRDVEVPDFATIAQPFLSDVTIASDARPADDWSSPFFKNGYVVSPNPSRVFGRVLNRLFYYAEAYNVGQIARSDETYVVRASLSEANRATPVEGLVKHLRREAVDPDPFVGSFEVGHLITGTYVLRLTLLDERDDPVAERAERVFIHNPDLVRDPSARMDGAVDLSAYARMSDSEVRTELDRATILASPQERRRIRTVSDLDGARTFLVEFWRLRDSNPRSSENEFKLEFDRRIAIADVRYADHTRDGWKTDRGRIYVKYGPPTSIEPHLYDRETVPHEIWEYNNIPGEGHSVFVFADRTSFGDFELVHSTVSGEMSLPDWKAELRR